MTPGQLARRFLGPAFQPVGEFYRQIFVDMAKVAVWIEGYLPPDAHVLDVGGGDGYLVNLLLDRRSDIRVTMSDIAPTIGTFISKANSNRVELLAGTDASKVRGRFDALTVADVLHHVPRAEREKFFAMLGDTAHRTGSSKILVKDIRPGNIRARLSLWSDLYVTGDKAVSLVTEDEILIPGFRCTVSAMPDYPNYCLLFER